MSFITKRERVFNEYVDPFDLPPRNEGKLKAYSSCTDTRAWSHFYSDKTEHLVEIIKRNQDVCRGKYVPVNVIIEMLMVAKNAEISRLKRKIGELEQMIEVFDQLELSCEQKCEIATAHAMIKAANKSLDEMALDLDTSNFTEGIDSEAFLTGKSGGDEPSGKFKGDDWSEGIRVKISKTNQVELSCVTCDVSTSAYDARIDEMQTAIINKDAKLNAMQNTIAVMENDVCEPYCIYAHIYTALEKIFAILRQNDKYRLFIDLMSSGKDTRCLDIKGKILFKLKVLEKFSTGLLAPCSERFKHDETCECYTVQVQHFNTSYALTSAESKNPITDNKRAHLIADIMDNEEMKEILSKDKLCDDKELEHSEEILSHDDYCIDTENLNRLRNLQLNYEDLMTCYEGVKFERDNLKMRIQKYEEMEHEIDTLKSQLREYNLLYSEREYYRKRSEGIDSLKEQFLVLADETSNIETQLKAETEINKIKSNSIEELRTENIELERRLNDSLIAFEKEKNVLQCKLRETECKVMCQDQQINSLSLHINRILEQEQDEQPQTVYVIAEMEDLKEQIKNLKEALFCSDDEKQILQLQFEDNLKLINELKMEIEDWKVMYEKISQRNQSLEKYNEDVREEIHKLIDENRTLSLEVEEKTTASTNLLGIIHKKSHEINKLMNDIEIKSSENKDLRKELQEIKETFGHNVAHLENEKQKALDTLQLTRQESHELLDKVKDYDELLHKNEDIAKTLEAQTEDYYELKNLLENAMEENNKLKQSQENNNAILLQEIQRLRDVNNYAADNINSLQNEKHEYQLSLELAKKDSEILEDKLKHFQNVREEINSLRISHENLLKEKNELEFELQNKSKDLEDAMQSVSLTKKESEILLEKIEQSKNLKEDMIKLSKDYNILINEKQLLQTEILEKNRDLDNLLQMINKQKVENEELLHKYKEAYSFKEELQVVKKAFENLKIEKSNLQTDFDNKTEENHNLLNTLECKIEENGDLLGQIKTLKQYQKEANSSIEVLQEVNTNTQSTLHAVRKESEVLINKLRQYEIILQECTELKQDNKLIKIEKEKLAVQLEKQSEELKKNMLKYEELNMQLANVMAQNENLEKSLVKARNEIIECNRKDSLVKLHQEVEDMKRGKMSDQNKIRELFDKLEQSENIISDLSEDLLARNDKISVLENHINSLQDEVSKLHQNLAELVTTGEEIKDNSYQKINQTLHKMEAHHSKATHNMKMEIAKLKNEKFNLEEQLSVTKIKSEESLMDRNKYISQIIQLENEKEIIVTDIKQLEISSVGDSKLAPNQCSVEDILRALDRIRKCLEVKHSKGATLEHMLLKVQTSSQLLLSKADEAKRLVEKEKQKIINEKEEAIADKLNMEKQLHELKLQLQQQNQTDKSIIKELQAEILNQELIISKFKVSTENYVTKLKEEMESLQNLYQSSLNTINELRAKIELASNENSKNKEIIDNINKNIDKKCNEIAILQQKLDTLSNKDVHNISAQIDLSLIHKNAETQVSHVDNKISKIVQTDRSIDNNDTRDKDSNYDIPEVIMPKVNKTSQNKNTSNYVSNNSQPINEVQILTANVEPILDFVKSSYIDYKIKRLSPGKLEQYSISCMDINVDGSLVTDGTISIDNKIGNSSSENPSDIPNLLDIYNRGSLINTSSKIIGNTFYPNEVNTRAEDSNSKEAMEINPNYNNILITRTNDLGSNSNSSPNKSTDKDLFLIYQDSESSNMDKFVENKDWIASRQPVILAEALSIKPDNKSKYLINPQFVAFHERQHTSHSNKQKLKGDLKIKINLPRVNSDHSYISTQERDGNNFARFSSHQIKNNNEEFLAESSGLDGKEHNLINKRIEINIIDSNKNTSRHKLSRIEADCLLFKDKTDDVSQVDEQKSHTDVSQNVKNFGLEYILDTVQRELNPLNQSNTKNDVKNDTQCDLYSQFKEDYDSEPIFIRLSENEKCSTFEETIDSHSNKTSDQINKSITEQGVSVNFNSDYYENKIQQLTQILENTKKDYKKKLEAIKSQYDSNIKSIINDHNQGVQKIQGLHEETLEDIIKTHENEADNLRTMSHDAMKKANKLEKENKFLKDRIRDCSCGCTSLEDEPIKMSSNEFKKRKSRCRGDTRMLTKTTVEAFNVKPKLKPHGPCTCSLDINVSDTIRHIFEQVDVEQRKLAEHTYLKYIANKILSTSVESLDAQELSFLHLKVCRTWKNKISKEEALQKRIDALENELVNKQRHAQQHIAELDRKVAEERRRLQEVRDAVCRSTPERRPSFESRASAAFKCVDPKMPPPPPPSTAADLPPCSCTSTTYLELNERRSAGDLVPGSSGGEVKLKRTKKPESRAVLAKLDAEERREKKLYDEHPIRLRRAHDKNKNKK